MVLARGIFLITDSDRKIDGAKLSLASITTLETFLMHFMCDFIKKYLTKLISHS